MTSRLSRLGRITLDLSNLPSMAPSARQKVKTALAEAIAIINDLENCRAPIAKLDQDTLLSVFTLVIFDDYQGIGREEAISALSEVCWGWNWLVRGWSSLYTTLQVGFGGREGAMGRTGWGSWGESPPRQDMYYRPLGQWMGAWPKNVVQTYLKYSNNRDLSIHVNLDVPRFHGLDTASAPKRIQETLDVLKDDWERCKVLTIESGHNSEASTYIATHINRPLTPKVLRISAQSYSVIETNVIHLAAGAVLHSIYIQGCATVLIIPDDQEETIKVDKVVLDRANIFTMRHSNWVQGLFPSVGMSSVSTSSTLTVQPLSAVLHLVITGADMPTHNTAATASVVFTRLIELSIEGRALPAFHLLQVIDAPNVKILRLCFPMSSYYYSDAEEFEMQNASVVQAATGYGASMQHLMLTNFFGTTAVWVNIFPYLSGIKTLALRSCALRAEFLAHLESVRTLPSMKNLWIKACVPDEHPRIGWEETDYADFKINDLARMVASRLGHGAPLRRLLWGQPLLDAADKHPDHHVLRSCVEVFEVVPSWCWDLRADEEWSHY